VCVEAGVRIYDILQHNGPPLGKYSQLLRAMQRVRTILTSVLLSEDRIEIRGLGSRHSPKRTDVARRYVMQLINETESQIVINGFILTSMSD